MTETINDIIAFCSTPKSMTEIMEHLTDFELVLTGACIATFCFGFNAFIKNVYLKNFKTTKS